MLKFTFSQATTTLKFSANTNVIILPKSVESFTDEEKDMIKHYSELARELYVQKVSHQMVNNIGKKLYPIQIRQDSLKEAITLLLEKYPNLEGTLEKMKASSVKLRKVKPKQFTYLDTIES